MGFHLSEQIRALPPLSLGVGLCVTRDLLSQYNMKRVLLGEFLFCASYRVLPSVTDLLLLVLLTLITVVICKMVQEPDIVEHSTRQNNKCWVLFLMV